MQLKCWLLGKYLKSKSCNRVCLEILIDELEYVKVEYVKPKKE